MGRSQRETQLTRKSIRLLSTCSQHFVNHTAKLLSKVIGIQLKVRHLVSMHLGAAGAFTKFQYGSVVFELRIEMAESVAAGESGAIGATGRLADG